MQRIITHNIKLLMQPDTSLEKDISSLENALSFIDKYENFNQQNQHTLLSIANKLKDFIDRSPNKPIYLLNLLDMLYASETATSKIITSILNYQVNHEFVLCRMFINDFLVPKGFNMQWFSSPCITAETDRIDICIQEKGKYAIIIENKLKGARFQRNQIARYIGKMRWEGFKDEQIFVIILPRHIDSKLFDHINQSVWRLPSDWDSPNQERDCRWESDAVSCQCDGDKDRTCEGCEIDLRRKFAPRTLILDKPFPDWLEDCCLPILVKREQVLASAIVQFADYLKGIYNNRINNKLNMEIVDFLRKEVLKDESLSLAGQAKLIEAKQAELEVLKEGLEKLRHSVYTDLIKQWYENLKRTWGVQLIYDTDSFYIEFNHIQCGCWYETDDKQPYWGFWSDKPNNNKIRKIHTIIERCGYSKYEEDKEWIAWDYTDKGDEQCERFYHAAKELGYLK